MSGQGRGGGRGFYRVVTLCGSMRFWDDMLRAAQELSREGYIVLAPFCVFAPGAEQGSEAKTMLDDMHFAKIDMSSEIFVVNPGGYVGSSTANEIAYARSMGKRIKSLEPLAEIK